MTSNKISWSEHRSNVLTKLHAADVDFEDGSITRERYLKILMDAAEQLTIPIDMVALRQATEKALHVHVGVSCAWLARLPRINPPTWCAHDYLRCALLCFARAVAQIGTDNGRDCGTCCYQLEGLPPFVALEWIDQDGEPCAAVLAHEHVEGLEYE